MLIQPKLKLEDLITCVDQRYKLKTRELIFLPLGADFNTAVYKLTTHDNINYFLKLRIGEFNHGSVIIPSFLRDLGITQVISPILSQDNKFYTDFENYRVILYPFIEGQNAIDVHLSKNQWVELGQTIKKLHTLKIPKKLISTIDEEKFSSQWQKKLTEFINLIDVEEFKDPISIKLVNFLKSKRFEINKLVKQVDKLGRILEKLSLEFVLCHADIHGWNLLIDNKNCLYLVDWDTLILAPRERDLMFIGAGIWNSGYSPEEEAMMFYQGYGTTAINHDAISYYRYQRIIQDMVEFCEHIFLSHDSEELKLISFDYLVSSFDIAAL